MFSFYYINYVTSSWLEERELLRSVLEEAFSFSVDLLIRVGTSGCDDGGMTRGILKENCQRQDRLNAGPVPKFLFGS